MFEFKKNSRILKSLEFKKILDTGTKVVCPELVIFGIPASADNKLGLIVSRKVGNAVVRNRVKRRLRESFRQELPKHEEESKLHIVVIARHTAKKADYDKISQALSRGIIRLKKRIRKKE